MVLISLSFKKIYKPTNNNLRTSSNTSRANHNNTPRINRGYGYDNQRVINDVRARENVAKECQKPKQAKDATYHKEKMLLCKKKEAGFQLNTELIGGMTLMMNLTIRNQKHIICTWHMFKREHPEQPESVNDTYLEEQGDTNITIDSLDMSTNEETVDQDDDDLANERDYKLFPIELITLQDLFCSSSPLKICALGLNHNLFSVGQLCDVDLEVAFRKSTCYIIDLKRNDLLTGSRGTDLYLITLHDTSTPNPICLMAKATSSQAWLWHRRLLRLNFINLILKGLHAQVETVRTDKGTESLSKTHVYFSQEGIEHQMSTARTPKQNGVVERWNRSLVEASRTMISAAKVPLFFWAEAIATTCFTQNCSLVIPQHEKTPYHIING
nr:ribonuclease H-like domain-containing protein [Tanacetum cinerariifolium]